MKSNLPIFAQAEPRSAPAHEVLLQRHQRQRVDAGRVEHGVDRVEHSLRPAAPRGALPAARPAPGDYGLRSRRAVTCHLSPVTCHLSPVTCHLSHVTNASSHSHKPSPC